MNPIPHQPSHSSVLRRVIERADGATIIIAEAANCHNGSLAIAMKMAEVAYGCGADIIKFQHHIPAEEMRVNDHPRFAAALEFLERTSLSLGEHAELRDHCKRIGIEYLCTPFCPRAVDELIKIGAGALKIGSGELTNLLLLRRILDAATGRDLVVVLSTGMASFEEVQRSLDLFRKARISVALMHCISEYPQQHGDTNLRIITSYRETFAIPIGLSDHTADSYTAFAAVALGARLIEKHFTLDRSQKGPDHAFALEPTGFVDLVQGIRRIEAALGDAEKRLLALEGQTQEWARHSLTARIAIPKGTILTDTLITAKRPRDGISPFEVDKVIGRVVRRDIARDEAIRWDDLA